MLEILMELARGNRGETIDASDVIVDVAIREVMQGMGQSTDFPIDNDFFVRVGTSPGRALTAKQPNGIVRIPTTASPPAVQIKDQTGNRIAHIPIAIFSK